MIKDSHGNGQLGFYYPTMRGYQQLRKNKTKNKNYNFSNN